MRNIFKAFVSAALVMALIFSFCGCQAADRSEEARTLCDTFCGDVKSGDVDKLLTYFNYDEISAEELGNIIVHPDLNKEEASFYQFIRDSLNYSIAAAEYNKDTKIAVLTVAWSMGDYESEPALNAGNSADLLTALASVPAKTVYSEVKIDLSGEFPRVMNPKEVIDAAYAFNDFDSGVMPGLLSDYYTGGSFVLAPKGIYLNTDTIGLRINFDKRLSDFRFVPGIVYTIARGEEVLFASDVVFPEDNSLRMDLLPEMAGTDGFNEDGFLIDGKYTFMVFDENFHDICSFECEVKTEPVEKEKLSFKEYKKDDYLSKLIYEFQDDELMANAFVYRSGWWDYDGTSVGKSAFASNTKTLGFSLAVSETNESELYYEYYFSEKADFKNISETEPVYQASCKPTLYEDQACYDLDFTPDEMKHGFYGLAVYSDASKKHIVFTASCMVVEETSQDVLD